VPASVLLAVLTAAGLLVLAPALVRRYDATERLVAERAQSTARVLQRDRRRRTVPGRTPVNPPRRRVTLRAAAPVSAPPTAPRVSAPLGVARPTPSRPLKVARRHTPAVVRRRRVFAALLLLNVVELVGVTFVSPGFWISVSVTGTLLAVYVVHLRNRAIQDQRRRRVEAREAAWLAARQAEVRREQARRAAQRRDAQRRLVAQREAVRRAARSYDPDLPAAASGGYTVSYRRTGGLRGRQYSTGRPSERR
jgi:hypothetical protein